MAVTDANLLIVSATCGSALGIAVGISFTYQADFVEVPAEGVTGSSAVGMRRSRFIATVDFLVGPPLAPNSSPASLVLVVYKMDGTTSVTYTITSMKPGTYTYTFHRESAPGVWTQEFINVSDQATDPLTIS